MTIFSQSVPIGVVTFNGTEGRIQTVTKKVYMAMKYVVVRLYFVQGGLKLRKFEFSYTGRNLQEEYGVVDLDGNVGFDIAFR